MGIGGASVLVPWRPFFSFAAEVVQEPPPAGRASPVERGGASSRGSGRFLHGLLLLGGMARAVRASMHGARRRSPNLATRGGVPPPQPPPFLRPHAPLRTRKSILPCGGVPPPHPPLHPSRCRTSSSMRALPKRGPARARRGDPGLSTLCRTVHTILRASDAVSTTSGRPTKMRTVALLEFKRVRAEIHRRGADATADLRSIFEMIG